MIHHERFVGFRKHLAEINEGWLCSEEEEMSSSSASTSFPLRYYPQLHEPALEDLPDYVSNGEWGIVMNFARHHPDALWTPLPPKSQNLLMVAVKSNPKPWIIRHLVELMPRDKLNLGDDQGNTPLHIAAEYGRLEDAKLLVEKNSVLLATRNKESLLPVHLAAAKLHKSMTFLFMEKMKTNMDDVLEGPGAVSFMDFALSFQLYDLALWMVEKKRYLAMSRETMCLPLNMLAWNSSAFRSVMKLGILKSLFYYCSPETDIISETPSPGNRNCQAVPLVKKLCEVINVEAHGRAKDFLMEPLFVATQNGVIEIVKEIVDSHPDAVNFSDDDGTTAIKLALMHRRRKIFEFLQKRYVQGGNNMWRGFYRERSNNLLHLVARNPKQSYHYTYRDTIFEMRRELLWFQAIEDIVHPLQKMDLNEDNKTPWAVFLEEHRELADKEKSWTLSIATSCSIVASLVATVAFAGVITVPGGENSDGMPNFKDRRGFPHFINCNYAALTSAIGTILIFLNIFTSQFRPMDFMRLLPIKVMFVLLFVAIALGSLFTAFNISLILILDPLKIWTAALRILLVVLLVLVYAVLGFPIYYLHPWNRRN